MPHLASLVLAACISSFVSATPAGFSKRQAGSWRFEYYGGDDHACSTSPNTISTNYEGGIGCTALGLAQTPEEAFPGGSVRIDKVNGGEVTPKLWFDLDCTDPVTVIQNSNDPTCFGIRYNFPGGPVAISADQAGA